MGRTFLSRAYRDLLDSKRVRFKAALERTGLRELRVHDLRHTYGTLMATAGPR